MSKSWAFSATAHGILLCVLLASYLADKREHRLAVGEELYAAGAQMAQFYKLPYYATGGMTDSKTLDAQSGYESAISGLLCALAGSNFIHDFAGRWLTKPPFD